MRKDKHSDAQESNEYAEELAQSQEDSAKQIEEMNYMEVVDKTQELKEEIEEYCKLKGIEKYCKLKGIEKVDKEVIKEFVLNKFAFSHNFRAYDIRNLKKCLGSWNLYKEEFGSVFNDEVEKMVEEAIELALLQQSKDFIEMIDKCKIHTAGALILIEKKELKQRLSQLNSQQNKPKLLGSKEGSSDIPCSADTQKLNQEKEK